MEESGTRTVELIAVRDVGDIEPAVRGVVQARSSPVPRGVAQCVFEVAELLLALRGEENTGHCAQLGKQGEEEGSV